MGIICAGLVLIISKDYDYGQLIISLDLLICPCTLVIELLHLHSDLLLNPQVLHAPKAQEFLYLPSRSEKTRDDG